MFHHRCGGLLLISPGLSQLLVLSSELLILHNDSKGGFAAPFVHGIAICQQGVNALFRQVSLHLFCQLGLLYQLLSIEKEQLPTVALHLLWLCLLRQGRGSGSLV